MDVATITKTCSSSPKAAQLLLSMRWEECAGNPALLVAGEFGVFRYFLLPAFLTFIYM